MAILLKIGQRIRLIKPILSGGQNWSDNTVPAGIEGVIVGLDKMTSGEILPTVDFGNDYGSWNIMELDEIKVLEE